MGALGVVGVLLAVGCGVAGIMAEMGAVGWDLGWFVVSVVGEGAGVGFGLGGRGYWMAVSVLVVYWLVSGFGAYYMSGSGGSLGVFGWLVVGFVSGVLVLLLSESLYTSLVGWEILGVISFLLIGYYCSRASWGGALFTLLINRFGDVGLVLMVWGLLGSLWGFALGGFVSGVGVGMMVMVCLGTKSAQVPLGGWLPLAMAAPTPVSALVHSSTLVIAGLFIAWLCSSYLGGWSAWLMGVGVGTVMGAGVSASGELDCKKVVAYSTAMHLGLMVMIAVVVSWSFMGVHMCLHAYYKSLLFVAVGVAIMVMVHDQDVRGLGMGCAVGAVVGLVLLGSVWSLIGLVYFSGWVTKDGLLEAGLGGGWGWVAWGFGVVGLGWSGVYSFKLVRGMVGSGFGKSSLGVEWGVGQTAMWWTVVIVGLFGVCSGSVWAGWGDWGVGAGVVGGGEKGMYWAGFGLLLLVWAGWGGLPGVGVEVGLESVLGRQVPWLSVKSGLLVHSMEGVWLGGMVGAVVNGVLWGSWGVSLGVVYWDWYFIVGVALMGMGLGVIWF